MRYSFRSATLGGASIVALQFGVAAVASAQTTPNLNAEALLNPFTSLSSQPSVLTNNLNTAVSVNTSSTAAQRSQAVIDNSITSDNGTVVADGLGSKLNAAYTGALVANNPLLAPSGNVVQAFRQGNGISQADSGFNKYYFANGTTNGTVASSLANANPNVYGKAYGNGTPAEAFGDPRPFQVSGAINNYAPTITAGLGNNPAFPSGHTTFSFTQELLFAQAVPEAYQTLVTRASEYGNSRIVLGAHYPLDVIAGRIQATYDVAQLLNNNPSYLNQSISVFAVGNVTTSSDYATLFANATTDLRSVLQTGCGGTIASCVATSAPDRFSNTAQDRADYTYRLTYGLPATGSTTAAPVVPAGAEVLLATRLPYLSAAQRRDVLASTEIASGGALDNGSGWARLNLYSAASGYGAFSAPVVVTQNAALGGFNAADTFGNDISGTGSLTKQGTGQLTLTGNNSYSGGTTVGGGRLVAASSSALGTGGVTLSGGTLVDATRNLSVLGAFSADAFSALEIDIAGAGTETMTIGGSSTLGGKLVLNFLNNLDLFATDTFSLTDANGLGGDFGEVDVTGISYAYSQTLTRTANGLTLSITSVPEPASFAVLLSGIGAIALVRRKRGNAPAA